MVGRGREVLNLRRQRPRGRGVGSPPGVAGAGSSRAVPISPEGPPKKRARHEEGNSCRGKDKETILITEEEGDDRGGETSEGEIDTEARFRPRDLLWAPEFRHYVGCLIHHADNVSNFGTAFGML